MARAELIENLNQALSLELAGVIQYSQHSYLVTGTDRQVFKEFFRDQAEEASSSLRAHMREHAKKVRGPETLDPRRSKWGAWTVGGLCLALLVLGIWFAFHRGGK